MDISSRHFPDLPADVSAAHDFSDASFQIPLTSKSPSKLLLAEDGFDLLAEADDTISSLTFPSTARDEEPSTSTTRTPRSRRRSTRGQLKPETPLRRSPRKRPAIPSPLKEAVAGDLSTALQDTISPFKRQQDFSFQIPTIGRQAMDLLMDDDGRSFLGRGMNATFEEGPSTPRAGESLGLSQLSPGPATTRTPTPGQVNAIDVSSQGPADQNTPPPCLGHRQHPPTPTPQDTSFSKPPAEVEALGDDHDESSEMYTPVPPLELATTSTPDERDSERMDDDTQPAYHASDAVEKEPTPPPLAHIAPSEPDGVLIGALPERDQEVKPTSTASGANRSKPSKSKPQSRGHARISKLPARKPISQPQPAALTKTQADRAKASEVPLQPNDCDSIDRKNISSDAPLSDLGGDAVLLQLGGQNTTAASSQSAIPTLSDPMLNLPEPSHTSSDMAAPDSQQGPHDIESESATDAVQLRASPTRIGDQTPRVGDAKPVSRHDPSSTPLQEAVVSPNEGTTDAAPADDDVDMADAFTSPSHADGNHLTAVLSDNSDLGQVQRDGQDGHGVSEKAPNNATNSDGHKASVVGPPVPRRTRGSNKRTLGDLEEQDSSSQSAQGPQRKKAKVVPASAAAAKSSRTRAPRIRAQKAKATSGTTTTATRGGKRSIRSSRPKRTTAPPTTSGSSVGESGVHLSLNRSATGPAAANGGSSSRTGHEIEHEPELNKPAGGSSSVHDIASIHSTGTSIGDVRSRRSGPATHVHMTRARTRASLEGANSIGIPFVSLDDRTGSMRLGAVDPSNAYTSTEAPERQNSPMEGAVEAENAQVGRHMDRSGTNQSGHALPRAKVTVPMEFHFESDARLEARRTGFTDGTLKQPTYPPIPDFKALHEAQARDSAARKDHVVPVQAQGFQFSTETRAHEREKYDEARRAREQEAERLLEEKRRLEALREEEEIRELRRRAVPKANQVPEWYQHAPKRSHKSNT